MSGFISGLSFRLFSDVLDTYLRVIRAPLGYLLRELSTPPARFVKHFLSQRCSIEVAKVLD